MIKNILTIAAVASLSLSAVATEDAQETSQTYVQSVLDLLDKTKSTNDTLSALKSKISTASTTAQKSAKKVTDTESTLSDKEARLASLPGKITWHEGQIETKSASSQRILRIHFPNATGVNDAIKTVAAEKTALNSKKGRLKASLAVIEADYNASIEAANGRIVTKAAQRDQLIAKKRENRDLIIKLRAEVKAERTEIKRIADIKNSGDFRARLQKANKDFKAAEAKAVAEQRNCRSRRLFGRYRDRSETCLEYRRSQDHLTNLRAIKNTNLKARRQANQQKRERAQRIEDGQSTLQSSITTLNNQITSERATIERLKEDKRIATSPTRQAIAQVDFDLGELQVQVGHTNTLKTLRTEINGHKSKIAGYITEQKNLPGQITTIQNSLPGLRKIAASDATTLSEVSLERETLVADMAEEAKMVEVNRLNLMSVLEKDQPVLAPMNPETPVETSTVIYDSRDWNVVTTEMDSNWERAACRAETTKSTVLIEGSEEAEPVEMIGDLQVVNLKNASGKYNEPIVTFTVTSTVGLDLNDYTEVLLKDYRSSNASNIAKALQTLPAEGGHKLNLIYSLSTESKLVFMVKLEDRAELIDLIARKTTMLAYVLKSDGAYDGLGMSLGGSSNSLKSSSKQSLRKACEGIEVTNF